MNEYRTDQPQNKKGTYYGIEDIFSPVKKAPVVKQPGKEIEFYKGIDMQGKNVRRSQAIDGKHAHDHFHCKRKECIIQEGIVSRVYLPEPYYPDYYGNNNALT